MTARQLPAQIEAELSILSTILCDRTGIAIEKALVLLQPDQFAAPSNRTIFAAMRQLYENGSSVDFLTVSAQLQRTHELEKLTLPRGQETREEAGRELLRELAADLPVVTRLPHHARLVVEAWGKRIAITRFSEPMSGLWNGVAPVKALREVERVCQELHSALVDEGASRLVTARQAATAAQERVLSGRGAAGGVPAPFPFLAPLQPGRLYILGGVAKEGKTVIAGQAARVACSDGVRTGVVTIEMPEAYLTDRILASFGVPYGPLQAQAVAEAYRQTWSLGLAEMASWPLDFLDDAGAEVADIVRFQKLGHYRFLIIDHLHKISYEEARDPRLRLSANVKALARLARTEEIPILLLAQLHRPPNSDGFPRPTMNSFKETSTIEQEASALWAIHRKRDEHGQRTDEAQFLVLADRYGTDGVFDLQFCGNYQRFTPTDWRQI